MFLQGWIIMSILEYKMIKLNFSVYQERLGFETKIKSPTQYIKEDEEQIILFFKNREGWEYYTIVELEDIKAYSEATEIEFEDAMVDFRNNYCQNCIPVEKVTIKNVDEFVVKSQDVIEAGEEMVDEADGYSDFLEKTFERFQKQSLQAVSKIDKSYEKKSFGEFLATLFNIVNTKTFAEKVKKYMKADMLKGILSAEDEVGIDIGYNENFENKLGQLYQQQLNGYTINGKRWPGIKGVTKEIQQKVIANVQAAIGDKKSIPEIRDVVQETFDGFTKSRSTMIARTETNRIINESKILGYKESGMEGGKLIKVHVDDRTSPICLRLNAKYGNRPIPLDEPFVDDETGKQFQSGPFHPNCRSTQIFRPI